MSLSDFSSIVVTGDGAPITRVGFGTLLLVGYHTHWADRTRVYTSLSEMAADNFEDANDGEPLYKAAAVAFAQNPRLSSLKIGRAALPATVTQRITPVAADSTTYAITIQVAGLPAADISVTSGVSATVDQICDAIQAAIEDLDDAAEPLEDITVTPSGATATHLTLTAPAGTTFWLSDWNPALLKVEDLTADPGIATDLNDIRAVDADWYGFATDQNGRDVSEEAADWAETQDVLYCTNTSDWQALDQASVDTDIQSVLAAKSYARTGCYFDLDHQDGYSGAAALAERFPFDPGVGPDAGGVFHGRTLRGVTADALTPAQKTVLRDKGYTVYVTTANLNHTLGGASASGEFLDYTRFVDWFRIRLAERKAQAIISNGRIPYDDRGIAIVESLCRAQLSEGLKSGGISPKDADGFEPSVYAPPLSATSQADRAARNYPGVQIAFKYAGAIHFIGPTTITVTL